MQEQPRQMPKTNCPRCGTTQVYAVIDRVVCLCCQGTWAKDEFIAEVNAANLAKK